MIIKNYSELVNDNLSNSQKKLRKIALEALQIAIEAVKPGKLMKNALKVEQGRLIIKKEKYDISQNSRIFVIGGGKASVQMAASLENIFSNHFPEIKFEGLINIPEGLEIDKDDRLSKIEINYASHPIPNKDGLKGVKKMMKLVANACENDFIITLISGGGSALLPLPKKPLKLDELKNINSLLLESGANIHEINTVRKHLSDFKGGNLARYIWKTSRATLISLIISDVVGNTLDSIASGPTVPDSTTFEEAIDILKKYNLLEEIPQNAREILEEGSKTPILENPKPNDPCFERIFNYLIGSVKNSVDEVREFLAYKEYDVKYFSDSITGEAREYAADLYNIIKKETKSMNIENMNKLALIATGELTVTIRGNGIGGRNQEMLLSFLHKTSKNNLPENFLVLGANLDGIEGNSKAMGAIVDNNVIQKAQDKDIRKYLKMNDSNSFFKQMETEIISGPTGCNVNDILLVLVIK
jgi:glycerate-2-kinase